LGKDTEHDMTQEVIALLMPDKDAGASGQSPVGVQALVRNEDGGVMIKDVSDETAIRHHAVGRFHRSVPIKDPVTREVIGYELEPEADDS
jgi:hypothetical protein